ncbi:hypothetical protein [Paenibacillus sp. OSY-SE]|nr:hypothetical protein [Paenibacillus sp. OSY-SE]
MKERRLSLTGVFVYPFVRLPLRGRDKPSIEAGFAICGGLEAIKSAQ